MVNAMIHSLGNIDEVEIVKYINDNDIVVRYHGCLYTAIFNIFTGLYYVDDIYGLIEEEQ